MRTLLRKLWADDQGALLSIEFLLIASILVFGLVVGLTTLRNAVTAEFATLADALLALNFSFSVGGLSGCCSSVGGAQTIVIPSPAVTPPVCTPPVPTIINVTACP